MRKLNLAGQRFHRLLVLQEGPPKGKHNRWLCRCDCGNMRLVVTDKLTSGKTKSCGCYTAEALGNRRRKHGMSNTPEYGIWCDIHKRCYNPNHKQFQYWGGRGIRVCSRWRGQNGFARFIGDVGLRPFAGTSIDRIDNNGNYTPTNCQWTNAFAQANNKRNNRFIVLGGEKLTVAQWARRTGILASTIQNRLNAGWSVDKTLQLPVYLGRNQYSE